MKLVATIPVSNCHIATKDGETMIFDEVVDLSTYAGALGDTPYYMEIIDGSSVEASAWIAGAGGGEALSAEQLSNYNFSSWSGDDPDDWGFYIAESGSNIVTEDAFGAKFVYSDGNVYIQQTQVFNTGRIYKSIFSCSGRSGNTRLRFWDSGNTGTIPVTIIDSDGTTTNINTATNTFFRARIGTQDGVGSFIVNSLSVKYYTDVPATGLHLVSAKDGSTRNLEANAGINPNTVTTIKIYSMDATGTTTDITSNQATLNVEITGAGTSRPVGIGLYDASDDSLINTVTELTGLSGKVHLAIKDGEAMVFVDDVDLADYAGSDDGNTPNLMILEDSSGNICSSYIGAVGGGETLSSEQLTNADFSSDEPPGTDWTRGATWTITGGNAVSSLAGTDSNIYQVEAQAFGRMYKYVYTGISITSGKYSVYFHSSSTVANTSNQSTTGDRAFISTPYFGTYDYVTFRAHIGFAGSVAGISCKYYTDIPATGLHLIDQPDGSTRNIAYKDTSFNPNDVVAIKIFNRFTLGNDTDSFVLTGLSPATAYSWYPKADDGTIEVTGDTVNFTTNTKPYASSISPADGETVTETDVTLSATFNDDEGGAGSLRFYNAEDDSLIDTAIGVADGATGQVTWSGLTPGQSYQFYVVPNDGTEDGATSATITFKVAALGRGFSPFYSPFGDPFNSPFQNM